MQAQLIETYRNLMTSLATLPDEIAAAQSDLSAAKAQQADTKRRMEDIELMLSGTVEGKNADERKAKLADALKGNRAYQDTLQLHRKDSADVAALNIEVDKLTNQYAAVGYQARLHSALLTYLGSAGVPVSTDKLGDVMFQAPVAGSEHNPPYVTPAHVLKAVNGSNHMTAADAADMGL